MQLFAIRPVTGFAKNFAKHAGRQQAGQPCKIDGRLGMSRAAEHAPFHRDEWKQVPRPREVVGLTRGIANRQNGLRALGRGDAGASGAMIDRNRVIRSQRRIIGFHHRVQTESLADLG